MNNKGFTMIEVIAIIALLGIILVISMPKFFSMRDENKVKEKNTMIQLIINSGTQYLINNEIALGGQVTIATLCSEAYIECPVTNPVDNSKMDGYVESYNNANGELSYRYVE